VRMQIEIAEGRSIQGLELEPGGHAMEARLYAEDPGNGFLPSTGKILAWRPPQRARVDSGITTGSEVSLHYDPMLAKIIVFARSRGEAIRQLRSALDQTLVHGVTTNRDFLMRVLDHPDFAAGRVHADFTIRYERDRSGEAVAKAALEAYRDARHATRKILPHVPPGYRNNPFHEPREKARVISCDATRIRIEVDGAQHAFDISGDAARYWVGNHVFPRVSRYPEAESAASEESASSPMPGQVLRILVEPGCEVHPGQPLVILEAMKMEQTVRAHAEGIVDAVLVKPGQVVAPGETLVHVRAKESK